jgi:Helix-turn-helix domain
MSMPRCRDRAAQWRADMARVTNHYYAQATTPEQHAEIEAAYAAALAEGPDFTRHHRKSEFRHPPTVNTDRNFIARIMFMADTIERKSYAVREKGKHGGTLGRSALTVLRVLLFVVQKREGCLYPSLETIAKLARMSKPTVIKAITTLVLMGFLTVYRRCKRIMTPLGIRVCQDSNCYEYHPPTGLGALGWAIWKPAVCFSGTGDHAPVSRLSPQLAQPKLAARPLPVECRDAFLQAVAAELRGHEVGPASSIASAPRPSGSSSIRPI